MQGLEGGGDIRYLIYALADIDFNEGNKDKAVKAFTDLCKDDLPGACQRLKLIEEK